VLGAGRARALSVLFNEDEVKHAMRIKKHTKKHSDGQPEK